MNRTFVALGSSLAFLGVALGAFGTHGLKDRLSPASIEIWKTAVQYHLIHALALVFIGLLASQIQSKNIERAGWLIFAGTIVFAGSLYALAVSGIKWLGAITPLGGVCFLAGWLMIAVTVAKYHPNTSPQKNSS